MKKSKADLLSRLSQGCLGWALSAIEDDGFLEHRLEDINMISSLMSSGIEKRFTFAVNMANEVSRDRQAIEKYFSNAYSWWRDLMHVVANCQEAVVNIDYMAILEEQAKSLSLTDVKNYIDKLYSTEAQISKNVNTRLAFESLMLNMPIVNVPVR